MQSKFMAACKSTNHFKSSQNFLLIDLIKRLHNTYPGQVSVQSFSGIHGKNSRTAHMILDGDLYIGESDDAFYFTENFRTLSVKDYRLVEQNTTRHSMTQPDVERPLVVTFQLNDTMEYSGKNSVKFDVFIRGINKEYFVYPDSTILEIDIRFEILVPYDFFNRFYDSVVGRFVNRMLFHIARLNHVKIL